jgi:hypothetical protein
LSPNVVKPPAQGEQPRFFVSLGSVLTYVPAEQVRCGVHSVLPASLEKVPDGQGSQSSSSTVNSPGSQSGELIGLVSISHPEPEKTPFPPQVHAPPPVKPGLQATSIVLPTFPVIVPRREWGTVAVQLVIPSIFKSTVPEYSSHLLSSVPERDTRR